jgi:hypothetical protein
MTRKIKLFFEKTMILPLKSTSGLALDPARLAKTTGIIPDK